MPVIPAFSDVAEITTGAGRQLEERADTDTDALTLALRRFATVRKRPAIFLYVPDSLDRPHLHHLRTVVGDAQFDSLDLVVTSTGGDIHVAYQVIELLRLHTRHLQACVPVYAKSAATLLCLGADSIVVDKLAHLGPLDAQIYESQKGGKFAFTSALNPFKTLEQLQKFALETLDLAAKMITGRSSLSVDESLKHAIDFSQSTTRPLFAQLDPEKLGQYSRALAIGTEYADRLLRRFSQWDDNKREAVIEQLVHGYPSHDYIIDFHELAEMGFDVNLFTGPESQAIQGVHEHVRPDQTIVDLVLPDEGTAPEGSIDEEAQSDE